MTEMQYCVGRPILTAAYIPYSTRVLACCGSSATISVPCNVTLSLGRIQLDLTILYGVSDLRCGFM
jgi:hypothetical protein